MMKLSRIYDTFIFDWDGTLRKMSILYRLNTIINPSWRYKKARAKGGLKSRTAKEGLKNYTKGSFRARELKNDIMVPFIDLYMLFSKPVLNYAAKEVLEELDRKGLKIALFTDGSSYRVFREVNHLHIDKYFDTVLSAQSIGKLKPDPLGLEIIISALRSKKSKTVYVGDMVDDILAAKEAGIDSCSVATGLSSFQELAEYKPNYTFYNMEEIKTNL